MKHVVMTMIVLIQDNSRLLMGIAVADGELYGNSFEALLPPIVMGNMTLLGTVSSHECNRTSICNN